MPSATRPIRVAHSPDADDAFMFHALSNGRIETGGLEFEHVLEDIETLNRRAEAGEYEVSAVSIHAYPAIADRYALMNCGASMGEGYGPVVVSSSPLRPAEVPGRRLAVPGLRTSAYLAAVLRYGRFDPVVARFDEIPRLVASGAVDAGVLIHEAQLTYAESALHLVEDLGQWWVEDTGLPLPLGGNVVRRDLGPELVAAVTAAVRDSIRWGLEHRREALGGAARFAPDLAPERTDRFVRMYVNERTLDYGPDGRRAVRLFLERAVERGLLDAVPPLDFIGSEA